MGVFSNLFGSGESKKTTIKITDEINIMEAINAHIHWKIRLEKYLDGTSEEKLDPKLICRDDQCKLGKWIHGPALKYFHDDDQTLHHLRDVHALFHVAAASIVTSVQANDLAAAEALMDGEYTHASRKVVHGLTMLSKHMHA
jgi:hypothetical protein